jgi:hypothetical protein
MTGTRRYCPFSMSPSRDAYPRECFEGDCMAWRRCKVKTPGGIEYIWDCVLLQGLSTHNESED